MLVNEGTFSHVMVAVAFHLSVINVIECCAIDAWLMSSPIGMM